MATVPGKNQGPAWGGEKRGLSTYPSGHGAGIRRGHNVTAAFEIDVMRTKKESQKHALSICTSQSAIFFLFSFFLLSWGRGAGYLELEWGKLRLQE